MIQFLLKRIYEYETNSTKTTGGSHITQRPPRGKADGTEGRDLPPDANRLDV